MNLTDDEDPISPRYIGLTRSLLFGALVQAASETRTGLVDLDDDVQQQVIDSTQAALQRRASPWRTRAFDAVYRPNQRRSLDQRVQHPTASNTDWRTKDAR